MYIRPSDECLIKNNNDEKHLKGLLYTKCIHFIISINVFITSGWDYNYTHFTDEERKVENIILQLILTESGQTLKSMDLLIISLLPPISRIVNLTFKNFLWMFN